MYLLPCHSRVTTTFADVLVFIWKQDISIHHACKFFQPLHTRAAEMKYNHVFKQYTIIAPVDDFVFERNVT